MPIQRSNIESATRTESKSMARKNSSSIRKVFLTTLLLLVASIQVGCVVPIYSGSPDNRTRQMIYVSEGFRHINGIWERIWGLEMPDLATPYRTHGGVI